jgi:hypothetical protein
MDEIIELAVEYDQLDIPNLSSFARLCRRQQFIEEGHRQKLEEQRLAKVKDVAGVISEHFSGRPRMLGGAIISPALLKSAADRAAQDNELVKQQRKAADARIRLRSGKQPKT